MVFFACLFWFCLVWGFFGVFFLFCFEGFFVLFWFVLGWGGVCLVLVFYARVCVSGFVFFSRKGLIGSGYLEKLWSMQCGSSRNLT